jgi:PKD repeat protein
VDSWAWVFTGALPDTSTQPSPHIFLSSGPGTYDCSVTATNVNGSTQFNFQLVIGGGPPPP